MKLLTQQKVSATIARADFRQTKIMSLDHVEYVNKGSTQYKYINQDYRYTI